MSRYDGTDTYTYPDTGVLLNKANIRNQDALDAFEADATALRMLAISEHPIDGNFDLSHLQSMSGQGSFALSTSARVKVGLLIGR
jgi:cell filamentation protein